MKDWLSKLIWKFRLWRQPWIKGFDHGSEDIDVTVYGKILDGKVHILYIRKEGPKC